ncbi:MAG: DUF4330 family protein [Clostridia bacterium]|nr:DUF4330 family protein [Clostridia bacterium]
MATKNIEDKPRFNIADAIILIVTVLIIAGIVLRVYFVANEKVELDTITAEFRITNISSEHIDLSAQDMLYLSSDNSHVGYIIDLNVGDMWEYAYNAQGELVKATVPGKSLVTGTLALKGVTNERGFYLNGTMLVTEGDEISFYTKNREVIIKIVKITG